MFSISKVPLMSTAPDTTHWRTVARHRLNETTKLISDSGSSEAELVASLSTVEHSKVVGDATGHCRIIFYVKFGPGAPDSASLAPTSFQEGTSGKALQLHIGRAQANKSDRVNNCKLGRGDIYCYIDGGKRVTSYAVGKLFVSHQQCLPHKWCK